MFTNSWSQKRPGFIRAHRFACLWSINISPCSNPFKSRHALSGVISEAIGVNHTGHAEPSQNMYSMRTYYKLIAQRGILSMRIIREFGAPSVACLKVIYMAYLHEV